MKKTVTIVYFPGTNSHRESARAFTRVGLDPRIVFMSDVLAGRDRIDSSDVLLLPGGFAFGDHMGAGTIPGQLLAHSAGDQLAACRKRPILAVCNGFQIAVRAGLFGDGLSLADNTCGTFRNITNQPHEFDRENPSPWLEGLRGRTLRFPCAHGEGRLLFSQRDTWRTAVRYPANDNPDGTTENITGITTADGLVLGLMNHPERWMHDEANLELFANAKRF